MLQGLNKHDFTFIEINCIFKTSIEQGLGMRIKFVFPLQYEFVHTYDGVFT